MEQDYKSQYRSKKVKVPNRWCGSVAVLVWYWCGTGVVLVRYWCARSMLVVLLRCGTFFERYCIIYLAVMFEEFQHHFQVEFKSSGWFELYFLHDSSTFKIVVTSRAYAMRILYCMHKCTTKCQGL